MPKGPSSCLHRLGEVEDEGFRAAIDAVEKFRGESQDRGDVDDGALFAGDEGAGSRGGQAGDGDDVEFDHGLDRRGVELRQRAGGGHAGIVQEQGDISVLFKALFDEGSAGAGGEVGGQDVDGDAGGAAEFCGERVQAGRVPRGENEVMAAMGETVRIDGADAGGCAGD